MENFNKNKCLITGGAGFIGSHLVDRLLKMNFDVTVIDDLSTGKVENVNKKAKFICNAATNLDTKNNIINDYIENMKFDFIFHLAANASVPYTVEYPLLSNKTNIVLTLEMLEAAKRSKVKKFVFASSSAIYGNPKSLPTSEEEPVNLLSPYALQKYTSEQYCEQFRKLYGLSTVSLRFFNVYGPRQNGSGPYANVISSWATKLINNEEIRLVGTGSQKRDFIYVDDVVDILVQSALSKDIVGIYNVGTGNCYTIKEVLDIFKKNFTNIIVNLGPARLGDPEATKADTTKLFQIFGERKFCNFTDSLTKTIESYKVKK